MRSFKLEYEFDPKESWKSALQRCSQGHPNLNIWSVGDQYPKRCLTSGVVWAVSFNNYWTIADGNQVLSQQGLDNCHPRQLFGISQKNPELHRSLGLPWFAAVTLDTCDLDIRGHKVPFAPRLWVSEQLKEARLVPAGYIFEPTTLLVGIARGQQK